MEIVPSDAWLQLLAQNTALHEKVSALERQLHHSEERVHELERQLQGTPAPPPPFVQIHQHLGVLHYLRSIDPSSVRVTFSGFNESMSSLHSPNVFSLDYRFTWCSTNVENSWIAFELVGKTLALSSYSLRSYLDGSGCYLKSFRLRGSRDGKAWDDIDMHRLESAVFQNNTNIVPFDVRPASLPYSHFKFIQVAPNAAGNHHFCLSFVELFGDLHDAETTF
jgi:hypothetical protein